MLTETWNEYYERKRAEIVALPDDPKPEPEVSWEEYYASRMEMIERGELVLEGLGTPIAESDKLTEPTSEATPKRKRGRPTNAEDPLSLYLVKGVDENEAKEKLHEAISQTTGKAGPLAEIEVRFITEGVLNKYRIPYKVLKREFGDLINCSESNYNKKMSEKHIPCR